MTLMAWLFLLIAAGSRADSCPGKLPSLQPEVTLGHLAGQQGSQYRAMTCRPQALGAWLG